MASELGQMGRILLVEESESERGKALEVGNDILGRNHIQPVSDLVLNPKEAINIYWGFAISIFSKSDNWEKLCLAQKLSSYASQIKGKRKIIVVGSCRKRNGVPVPGDVKGSVKHLSRQALVSRVWGADPWEETWNKLKKFCQKKAV
ncbi:MAG: hypothetical protein ABEI53_00975 [Candidatus Magasanikbacteria bacterium]